MGQDTSALLSALYFVISCSSDQPTSQKVLFQYSPTKQTAKYASDKSGKDNCREHPPIVKPSGDGVHEILSVCRRIFIEPFCTGIQPMDIVGA